MDDLHTDFGALPPLLTGPDPALKPAQFEAREIPFIVWLKAFRGQE